MTDRTRVFAGASGLAVVVFGLIGVLIDASGWQPPLWLASPSAAAVFGLALGLYDRYLWRKRLFGFRLSSIPDLNGKWGGAVDIEGGARREEEGLGDIPTFVEISQSWTKIRVLFETPFSQSESQMAMLRERALHYEYLVEPKAGTAQPYDLQMHGGLARLTLSQDLGSMHGDFFGDQHYQRFGKYTLQRLPSESTAEKFLGSRVVYGA